MSNERVVGLIGLGLVGRALAARLSAAGYEVIGTDAAPAARSAFPGAKASAAEVCAQAARVFLAVFETSDVERVTAQASPKLFIDCTTGDPERVEALAAKLAARGVGYVEARLSGSSDTIRRGVATMYVGGDASQCEDLLEAIAAHRRYIGGVGMAARAKLATNLVLGLSRAALAEGMALAERLGVERRAFLELLKGGPAASPAALGKGEKMASGDFTPDSRIRQHLKDVELMMACARKAGIGLPLTAQHEKLLRQAVEAGDGELDNAAIILQYTRSPA